MTITGSDSFRLASSARENAREHALARLADALAAVRAAMDLCCAATSPGDIERLRSLARHEGGRAQAWHRVIGSMDSACEVALREPTELARAVETIAQRHPAIPLRWRHPSRALVAVDLRSLLILLDDVIEGAAAWLGLGESILVATQSTVTESMLVLDVPGHPPEEGVLRVLLGHDALGALRTIDASPSAWRLHPAARRARACGGALRGWSQSASGVKFVLHLPRATPPAEAAESVAADDSRASEAEGRE